MFEMPFFPSEKFLGTGLGKCFLVAETETLLVAVLVPRVFFFWKVIGFGRYCDQIHLLSVYLDRAKIIIRMWESNRVGIFFWTAAHTPEIPPLIPEQK